MKSNTLLFVLALAVGMFVIGAFSFGWRIGCLATGMIVAWVIVRATSGGRIG